MNMQKRTEMYWVKKLKIHLKHINPSDNFNRAVDRKAMINTERQFIVNKDVSAKIINACNNSEVNFVSFFTTALTIILHRVIDKKSLLITMPGLSEESKILWIESEFDKYQTFRTYFDLTKNRYKTNSQYLYSDSIESVQKILDRLSNTDSFLFDVSCFPESQPQGDINHKVQMVYEIINGQVYIKLKFNSSYFSTVLIETVTELFEDYLNTVFVNLNVPIHDLELITQSDKDRLNKLYELTSHTHAKTSFLEELITSINSNSEYTCVIGNNGEKFTYEYIQNESNRLAHYIVEKYGVKKDDRIAVSISRSENIIITMLAILKSGGTFVPIDPAFKASKINHIVEESNVKLIISEVQFKTQLETTNKDIYCIDNDEHKSYSAKMLLIEANNKRPVYIIFTSGTTGVPKGVPVRAESLQNYVNWFRNKADLTNADKTVLLTSYAFDLSYTSLWGSLLSGSEIYIPDSDIVEDPALMLDYLISNQISYLKLTPTYLSMMLNVSGNRSIRGCESLRLVVCGGEPIRYNDINLLCESVKGITVLNHYGPTESTIGVISHEMRLDNITDIQSVSLIGSPIKNMAIFILDDENRIVPQGVMGELCIAGIGLTNGYLDQTRNEGKFVTLKDYNTKVYKTGDLGKWDNEGRIEFHGRKDRQVKIRGYRVELGEIEHELTHVKGVSDAYCIYENSEIHSYIVFNEEVTLSELHQELLLSLDDYKIPSIFFSVPNIPMNENGKVDAKKLINIEKQQLTYSNDVSDDIDEIMKELKTLWNSILGENNYSAQQNFFQVGGNSLKAVQLASRIEDKFQVKCPVKAIFKNPTLKSQRKLIDTIDCSSIISMTHSEKKTYYQVTDSQKEIWLTCQLTENPSLYNMVEGFHLGRSVNLSSLEKAFRNIVMRHEVLRTNFMEIDGIPKQFIHEFDGEKYSIHSQLITTEESYNEVVQNYVEKEMNYHFDLVNEPLVKLSVLYTENKKTGIVFNIHHLISDGWSMNVILKELFHYYSMEEESNIVPLPSLKYQFRDYSEWVNRLSSNSEEAHEFWKQQFAEITERRGFLPDVTTEKTGYGASYFRILDVGLEKEIKQFCSEKGFTSYAFFLFAISVLFSRYEDKEQCLVGTPNGMRNSGELESLIGLFTDLITLNVKVDKESLISEQIEKIKEMILAAWDYSGYPIQQFFKGIKKPGETPFAIGYTHHNHNDMINNGLDNTKLDLESISIEATTAKTDLWFHTVEDIYNTTIRVEYDIGLYSKTYIETLCARLIDFIQTLVKSDIETTYVHQLFSVEQNPIEDVQHKEMFNFNF